MTREPKNGEPRTKSGIAWRASADAIAEDWDGFARRALDLAEDVRKFAAEVPGAPGILGATRGIGNQLEMVADAMRERAGEVREALIKGPRESVDQVQVIVNPEHASRVRETKP